MSNGPLARARRINRRAFLRGAAGVSVALPFLESLPERSAWAADDSPVFGLFICGTSGVVPTRFFPDRTGPLTPETLGAAGKATSELSAHARRLLFITGIDYPAYSDDSHIDNFCAALTGRRALRGMEGDGCGTSSHCAMASGPSADAVIASKVHPGQLPLVLSLGDRRNGYAAERLSFAEPGKVLPAAYNPYELYEKLIGLTSPGDGTPTPDRERAARLLLESRASVHDLVREELAELKSHPRLSSADRQRLELHLQSIRDAEVTMGGMGNEAVESCTSRGLNVTALEALQTFAFDPRRVEEIGQLYLSLVALAFACNYRRTASLQWGDPYDRTIYDVPSNARGWRFAHIMHRIQSDAQVGDDPLAERAHMEIDAVRMRSLAVGLDHFEARGLGEHCFVLWTNQFAGGHSITDVPHIVWGSGGGYLKQGAFLDAGGVMNGKLHNTLITAAIRHTGETMEDFGEDSPGQLDAIRA